MHESARMIAGIAALLLTLLAARPAAAGPMDAPGYAKAFACSACHGLGGASRADTMPVLAGMSPQYFTKAIEDYASGRRPSAEMQPFARMVLELGLDEVAGYFAAQPFAPTPIAAASAAVARGRAAAAPCAACHGAGGQGDPARTIPPLRGQPPGYLANQMLLFKHEARSPGDAQLQKVKELMRGISEATIGDLAAYYSSLR